MINRKIGSAAVFSILLLLSLCSCGGQDDASVESPQNTQAVNEVQEDSSVQLEETEEGSDPPDVSPTASPLLIESNPDLTVIAAFVYDNDTYVVVENTGEQAILNYQVAYVNFDDNSFVATTDPDGYERGKNDTVNLMPGEKSIAAWYGASGNYAVATICEIDYADGTTWEMVQVDQWAEEVSNHFSADEHKAGLAELKNIADQAESNEYATLTDLHLDHGNRYSTKHDFNFSIRNTCDQGILRVNLFVLEYDENGFPVSVSPYDTYCINGHRTGGTVNLAAGQSGSYTDDLFISPTTTQIKAVISYLEFQDGTDWENPYLYEWIIANNGAY